MSNVIDAIKRLLGYDHGTQPDSEAASVPATPTQTAAAESAIPPTADEPAEAMPGEEAERPIQPTAPPTSSIPFETASPPTTEPPAEASSVLRTTEPAAEANSMFESTEVERATEPTGPQADAVTDEPAGLRADATAEPLGNAGEQERPASGVGVDEAVRSNVGEKVEETAKPIDAEGASPPAGQLTAIKDSVETSVEGRVADVETRGKAVTDEAVAPSESTPPVRSPDFLQTDTAAQPTRPEEPPEPQMRTDSRAPEVQTESESYVSDEDWLP